MSRYPIAFAVEQEQRAAARLALLNEQEYWSIQMASQPAFGVAPPTAVDHHRFLGQSVPNRADPYLGRLLHQRQASLPPQPAYAFSSAPLYSSSPPLPQPTGGGTGDARAYLKQLTSSLMSQPKVQTWPEPSFSSPALPLSATTLGRQEPLFSENQREDTVLPLAQLQSGAEKKRPNFPLKLMEAMALYRKHQVLTCPRIKPAFQWLDDESCFVVLDEGSFLQNVLVRYGLSDKYAKYSSFIRKMNRWGFVRRRSKYGQCFEHALFREGQFDLCATMQCKTKAEEGKLHQGQPTMQCKTKMEEEKLHQGPNDNPQDREMPPGSSPKDISTPLVNDNKTPKVLSQPKGEVATAGLKEAPNNSLSTLARLAKTAEMGSTPLKKDE